MGGSDCYYTLHMGNSMNSVVSVTFYFLNNSLSDISRKCYAVLIIFGKMHFLLISEVSDGTEFVELLTWQGHTLALYERAI